VKPMQELLRMSAALHQHLCPRQVLGVRMGMPAGRLLTLDLPQRDKRLVTISETEWLRGGRHCDGDRVLGRAAHALYLRLWQGRRRMC